MSNNAELQNMLDTAPVDSNNDVTEVTNEENTLGSPNDYKVIIDSIKEMEEQYNMLKEISETNIKSLYSLKPNVLMAILSITKESIKTNNSIDNFINFLCSFNDTSKMPDEYIKILIDTYRSYDSEPDIEVLRGIMLNIKEISINLYKSKLEADKLKEESNDILKEYIEYTTSATVQETRLKRLDILKQSLETITDDVQKKKIENMIKSIESTYSLSFIFERFDKFSDKEVKTCKDIFFDQRKSAYVITKFKNKIGKFGFNENLYKYFFNIEENFLNEKYHPFNNFFLFLYMRFIGYADPYNKNDVMHVQSLTSNMANLIYHKFATTSNEENFILIITRMLDKFECFREYFEKYNTTQPKHPKRIAADEQHEKNRKLALINKMKELNIIGYDENASADELQKYFNDKLSELMQSNAEENDDNESDEELTTDTSTDSSVT